MFEILNSFYNEFYNWFINEIQNNNFLVGTMVPLAASAILYGLVSIGRTAYGYLQRVTSVDVTVNSDNEFYKEICTHLFKNCVSNIFRRKFIVGSLTEQGDRFRDDSKKDLTFELGYGTSIGFIGIWPAIITREQVESQSNKFKEIVNVTVYGPRSIAMNRFYKGIEDHIRKINHDDTVTIKTNKNGYWGFQGRKPKRSLDTISIPEDKLLYIKSKIDAFLANEKYYIDKGIPYHLGLIFHGPPGTGKSSLIHAIASLYDRDLCLAMTPSLDIEELKVEKSILVIEDIDATDLNVSRNPEENKEANANTTNLSELLNTLDGIASPHGLITIATTNHIERLDPALLRHGRFDVSVELGLMEWGEWSRLCKILDRNNPLEKENYFPISPSEARYILTYYKDEEIASRFD